MERNTSQSIQRAFALLRVVAAAGPEGINLSTAAQATQLHVATAHRLLAALVRERAVSFDPYARVYHAGADFMRRAEESPHHRIREHYRPVLERLAARTGEVLYLYVRDGLNALCIDSVQGPAHTVALSLGAGGRRPLGIGAGTIVLLASLPARELAMTLTANESRYARYTGITLRQIKAMIRAYRSDGYVFHPGIVVPGVCGIGIPLREESGEVVAALSLAAPGERLGVDRRAAVIRLMASEVARAGPLPLHRRA
jgi:DNA-binding IclR family transcriptional regulator